MARYIILKNTETGQELTLPVTPSAYPMEAGRAVETLDMAETGQISLPGLKSLFDQPVEGFFPARDYPFLAPGAVADPWYYVGLLTQWSADAQVCRYIVSGTDINAPVLLGPLSYGEQDGSGDVYYTLPLKEYRYLEEVVVEETGNSSRPVEAASEPETADRYTVVKGDSLWAICKRTYGDGSLAYKLATANGVKNPNLIYPGQVLDLPDKTTLAGLTATPAPKSAAKKETTQEARETARETLGMGGGGGIHLMVAR